jgi:SAM-dependent methyltransferase
MRGVLAARFGATVEVGGGSAEATGLPDGDVDAIVAAQAFHWFDVERTYAEWSRILRGPRAALLVWNDRQDDTPFGAALAALLDRFQTERRDGLGHFGAARDAKLTRFVAAGARLRDTVRTRHAISLDHEALVAWSGSVSYLPRPGAPSHASMITALDEAFAQHQERGVVKLDFEAIGYCYALPTR